jgi:hypothetical protein
LVSEAGVVKMEGMLCEAGENNMIGGWSTSDFSTKLVSDILDTEPLPSTLSTCSKNN